MTVCSLSRFGDFGACQTFWRWHGWSAQPCCPSDPVSAPELPLQPWRHWQKSWSQSHRVRVHILLVLLLTICCPFQPSQTKRLIRPTLKNHYGGLMIKIMISWVLWGFDWRVYYKSHGVEFDYVTILRPRWTYLVSSFKWTLKQQFLRNGYLLAKNDYRAIPWNLSFTLVLLCMGLSWCKRLDALL